jgi:hypothetical protein
VPSLFSRKPATPDIQDEPAEPQDVVVRRGYTPSKKELGKLTPKRAQGGRKVEPPPANRREAVKRQREKQRQARLDVRAGMMAGKEEYLPKRDQGPERSLARDVVDARRNLASYFLPVALVVVVGTSQAMPAQIRLAANMLSIVMIVGVVADSFVLTRRLKKAFEQKFPKSATPPRSHYTYAIMRSLSFRRMRMPGPKVKLGQKVLGQKV